MCYTYIEAAVINFHQQAGGAVTSVGVIAVDAATESDLDEVQERLAALSADDVGHGVGIIGWLGDGIVNDGDEVVREERSMSTVDVQYRNC